MVLWPSLVVLWMRGWGEGDTDPEGLSASQWSCCPWVSVKQGEMGSHHLPAGFQLCPMAQGLRGASWSHMGWEQWALWLQGGCWGGTLPTGCSMPSF